MKAIYLSCYRMCALKFSGIALALLLPTAAQSEGAITALFLTGQRPYAACTGQGEPVPRGRG